MPHTTPRLTGWIKPMRESFALDATASRNKEGVEHRQVPRQLASGTRTSHRLAGPVAAGLIFSMAGSGWPMEGSD
jgi:hypothetical protein